MDNLRYGLNHHVDLHPEMQRSLSPRDLPPQLRIILRAAKRTVVIESLKSLRNINIKLKKKFASFFPEEVSRQIERPNKIDPSIVEQ